MPSYYLAVFYTGLVLGTGMLTLGIWDRVTIFSPTGKPSTSVRFAVPASALVVFVLIAGGYNHCNGQARAAASAKNPKLNGASDKFEECMSDPILLLIVWAPTFGANHPSTPPHKLAGVHTYRAYTRAAQYLSSFGRRPSSL